MFVDDPSGPLRVVSVLDPSLDRKAMAARAYADTRDPGAIRALPGERPLVFHLRPIPSGIFADEVDRHVATAARYRAAFMMAVEAIEGVGDHHLPWRPISQAYDDETGAPIAVLSPRDLPMLRKVGVSVPIIYEIGHLAIERTMLEGKAFGGERHYTLPPTSAAGLNLIERQIAARNLITSEEISEPSASVSMESDAATSG